MSAQDPFPEDPFERLQRSLVFLPVLGLVPALGFLKQLPPSDRRHRASRQALRLTGSWLLLYCLLSLGSTIGPELWSLRLLYLNGLFTSGYFLTCIWLLWRQLQAPQTTPRERSKLDRETD
ncbi:hypothetical protein [Synechocystis sp. LKSZ1]|uniref:hypothetical protein n=1 Tax=Synechocystis sp. LKSZ1 TaxID=3144951 RepID=UPI00336BC8C5